MGNILKRKIVVAILSSLLGALILSLPDLELNLILNLLFLNILFVLTYGVIASLFSDWVSKKAFKSIYGSEITSFILHCFFGGLFGVLSLFPAILFFVIDRLLRKVKINWWTVIILFILIGILFIIGFNLE